MSATAVPIRPIKQGSVLRLWLGLFLLSIAAVALAWHGTSSLQYQTTASGLQYRVIKEGEGPHPTTADITLIDYTGRLENGTIFDSTRGKQPVPMAVNGSIPGFSEGLRLMRKGAIYRFRIPPQLAYGSQGAGGVIPPNATLTFDVTLHQFMNMAQLQGMMGSGMQSAPPPQ
jgi:FKBP-type peptidyl-prolyl cis-trans isomerase